MKLLIIYLIIINVLGFVLMYIDKIKAIKHKWRISEQSLMFVAFIGGSVGSLLGMYIFRHKTKHLKFTLGIPIFLVIQLIVLFKYIL